MWALVLVVVVMLLVIMTTRSSFQTEIPKIIWTYWDDPTIPILTQKCLDNWKRMCPDYEIKLLNRKDVPEEYKDLTPQRQSDWLRLERLKSQGGIWLDASIILTESLDWVKGDGEVLMFYQKGMTADRNFPMYESWFMASIPNGKFITALFNEFDFACKSFGDKGNDYLKHLKKNHGEKKIEGILQNMWRGLSGYFTIYIAIQKIIRMDGIDPKLVTGLPGEDGPIRYQSKYNWDSEKVVNDLTGPWPVEGVSKLVKLVQNDRKALNRRDWSKFHPDSIISKFLI